MDIPATANHNPPARSLFSPWADVLLLGGGSVLAMLALRVANLDPGGVAQLAVVMIVLANFVNHPHFAYSYQMFYGSWGDVKRGVLPPDLSRRWWFAGVVAPVLLAASLAIGAVLFKDGHSLMLALTLTLMGVLVGWHYVKQGFGMAMMDAALKKCYWPAETRKALLMNAYACWGASFTLASGGSLAREFWGVHGIQYSIPTAVTIAGALVASGTTIWCGLAVYRCVNQWRAKQITWKQWPLAGLVAYVVTLYLWIGIVSNEPAFVLAIPFFHSIQYLAVVSRYKLNEASVRRFTRKQLVFFVLNGMVLGGLGFWLLPGLVDYARTGAIPEYNKGAALGIACAWIFINVHHYLIDNVLWRQGNPKVKQYLFDAAPGQAPQAAPERQAA
ncbi:MAG: hypothetical protein ACXWVG_00470 [Telluria sp.]